MKDIATKSTTNYILEKYDLYPKKKYGQNFLIDPRIVEKIVCSSSVDKECAVIEVGPGKIVDGQKEEMYVKKGDKVILNKYAGTEIKYQGEDLIIVKQSDILAIVE